MEADIFDLVDQSIKDWWISNGLSKIDFNCVYCGKSLLTPELTALEYVTTKCRHGSIVQMKNPVFRVKGQTSGYYRESDDVRWLLDGRILAGKLRFRHCCWNCLFEHIRRGIEACDDCRISPQNHKKWVRRLKNGRLNKILRVPPRFNSPVWWFMYLFDITDDELKSEVNKMDTASEKSFIRRYGKEEGLRRFAKYQKVQATAGISLEYFINKYGEEEGRKKHSEVNASRGVSKKNCIEKYGEEIGNSFFTEYCARQAVAGNTEEYFIQKFGEIAGKEKYLEVCSQKSLTLTNFVRKYGPELGPVKFKTYLASAALKPYSDVSQRLFDAIDKALGAYAEDSHWQLKNLEFEVPIIAEDGSKHIAKLDYCLGKNAIEFNGDFWHANPELYDPDEVLTMGSRKMKASEIWEHDKWRLSQVSKQGFDVKVVWEKEYLADPARVVSECVEWLKSQKSWHLGLNDQTDAQYPIK